MNEPPLGNAVVTGGGGFLGQAIVRGLLRRGGRVCSFSRQVHDGLRQPDVVQVQGDIADGDAVAAALAGADTVFHVAALAGIWGDYADYYRTNVLGTVNVISACRRHGIRRLVYTSSPSVVFTGADMEGVDEGVPYARHFEAHYPHTKALAEQFVRAANDATLATVSLRPHLVWGPGDNHLLPRLLRRARAGRLFRIGNGANRVDTVYIDNAAEAHLLAAERLHPGAAIGGRVYFISNGEPLPLWDLVDALLSAARQSPPRRALPVWLARLLAELAETGHQLAGRTGEPALTRFVVGELSTAHWFNIDAARRDLGYEPTVSIAEGLERLRNHLDSSAAPVPPVGRS